MGKDFPYSNIGAFRRSYRAKEGTAAHTRSHNLIRDYKQFTEFKSIIGKENMPKTLAEFQTLKYNKKEDFELLSGFKKANLKNHISPLVSFKVYKQVSKEIDEKLVGQTLGDITIKGKVTHFIDRVIGEYQESDYKQEGKRQGVRIDDALDALQNPLSKKERINEDGTKSLTFVGAKCKVTVNPVTGMLIQTNRNSRGKV